MTVKRTRRTSEQIIADLEAEIERIKVRAAQKKARKDPALRHVTAAIRSIDKALGETKGASTRSSLAAARAALAECLKNSGVILSDSAKPRSASRPDRAKVLGFIRANPRSRSVDICDALGTELASLRPVLHDLRNSGTVRAEGQARAMVYSAV